MIKKNFWARYGKSRERVHVLEFWPAGSDLPRRKGARAPVDRTPHSEGDSPPHFRTQ